MAKKTTNIAPVENPLSLERLEEAGQAANQLAVLNQQDTENTKVLAVQFSYSGPLDSDSLERASAVEMASHAQSTFRVGATLMLLRESCLHGDFLVRLDRLGITKSSAYRYISIAARFKNEGVRTALQGLGVGKVIELAALDDSEIQELVDGKSVRGLTVDKIETLSLKELRIQLSEAEKDAKAKDDYIKKLSEKVATLEVKRSNKIVADTDWPDALIPLTDQIAACKRDIDHIFSKLEAARMKAIEVMNSLSEDERPKYEAALRHVAEVYGSALESAERHYNKDLVVFSSTLGAFLED
jgi:hypothetical protein